VKLESLEIDDIDFEDGDGFPTNVVFDRMRKLNLAGHNLVDDEYQLDLIFQTPILESLEWTIDVLSVIKDRFAQHLWPQLKKLHIISFDFKDKESAFILNGVWSGLGGIEDLKLGYCELGTQASKALMFTSALS
jgi:hypothetical protein